MRACRKNIIGFFLAQLLRFGVHHGVKKLLVSMLKSTKQSIY